MTAKQPLDSRRVLVTRPKSQSKVLIELLLTKGAVPVSLPVIDIEPVEEVPGLDRALAEIGAYDWVIFTSVNGVEIFLDYLEGLGIPVGSLSALQVAAIGSATAESLTEYGLTADFVPGEFVGEALGETLPVVKGSRILLPRAMGSRPALPRILTERGAQVDEFGLYRAVQATPNPHSFKRIGEGLDVMTFTSPSTVHNFEKILKVGGFDPMNLPGSPITACIGPITGQVARDKGYQVKVIAQVYTVEGLVDALVDYFREGERV